MLSLTERVIQYQETGHGLREITDEILQQVYRYPRFHPGFAEDDCGEFCLHFYPRIARLLKRFRYCGIPFEAYLATNVRWQLKTYAGHRRRQRRMQSVRNLELLVEHRQRRQERVDEAKRDAYVPDPLEELVTSVFDLVGKNTPRSVTKKRRLFILALKGCRHIGDEQIARVATMTDNNPKWALECAFELRDRMARRDARAEDLRQRRNRAFLRLRMLQDQRDYATEASVIKDLDAALRKCRRRLQLAHACLAGVPRHPTHEDLAEVLGIPKGTVDSSMHYLREWLAASTDQVL